MAAAVATVYCLTGRPWRSFLMQCRRVPLVPQAAQRRVPEDVMGMLSTVPVGISLVLAGLVVAQALQSV
jgi:hypothetical protein